MRQFVSIVMFAFVLGPAVCAGSRPALPAAPACTVWAVDKYFRTELYFGLSKPDGTSVTDEDWADFLSAEVTPRFPAGFTIFEARGQYRDNSGAIVRERSRVLIFLYTRETRRDSRLKIEEIRNAYIKRFAQESVLRIDFRRSVEVDF